MGWPRIEVQITTAGAEPRRLLIEESVELGREGADMVLADNQVSRRHLRLYLAGARLVAEDLGSSNGTQVNGQAVEGRVYVDPGDVVTLGQTEVRVDRVDAGPAAAVEISPPERASWVLGIDDGDEVVLGRTAEVPLADSGVSRRHLALRVEGGRLVAEDLGSRNGTAVDGTAITGPVAVVAGHELTIGSTRVRVLDPTDPTVVERARSVDDGAPTGDASLGGAADSGDDDRETQAASAVAPHAAPSPAPPAAGSTPTPAQTPTPTPTPTAPPGGPGSQGAAAVRQRPALFELTAIEDGGVAVRYLPGTAGERAAPNLLRAAKVARRSLAGLGSEAWGVVPQICLVDPFPDPERPGTLVTEGTFVDAVHGEIWMVVTDERPPERPERPLAHLFAGALPAAAELDILIEGYGLHLAGAPDPDEQLRILDLPPIDAAEGELRSAMAVSFVRSLLAREGDEAFVRMLGTAQPARLDAACEEVYGINRTSLELAWRQELASGAPKPKPAQFVKLSWRYLRPHKLKQAEIFVYMMFALAFTAVFPFASRRLFDTALPSGEFSEVAQILIALGIAFVISMLAGLRQAYLTAYVSSAVVRSMREEMFFKIQRLPTAWFHRHQQGDVLTRLFSDVQQVEMGLTQTLSQGIFQMLTLVVSAVIMLSLDFMLGVIVLIGAPIVGVVYRAMGSGAQKRSLAVQEETGSLMGIAAENYSAQTVVKVFSLHRREEDRFSRRGERLFRAERRLALWGGIFGLSVNMIVTLLRLGILGLGAWLILEGRFTLGGLVAFLGVMGEVLNPVTALTTIGQALQSATGALSRIDEVLDESTGVETAVDAPPPPLLSREIRLADVSFSYTPERRALDHVDVTIAAGTRVAFVGPSGSGKSTVLRLLMRMHDPDEGAVLLDGVDIRSYDPAALRAQLGVVFQDNFLFDTTIRENIAMGQPGATDAEIQEAAEAAEADEFIRATPRGYDSPVGERGDLLSGGQRQRVAIARALIRNPRVLLLDEATSALDPRTERQITATLDRLAEGRTTIAITHRLTSVTNYDRIFVIADGRLVEQGTHDELVALGGVYARLWAEQTGQALPETDLDVAAALARVPVFEGLAPDELAQVAARLQTVDLRTGAEIPEGGGHLLIVARGRARVMAPSIGGERVVTTELGPGDTFGVGALLGQLSGLSLVAAEPVRVLVLDDENMAGLAAIFPTVGRRLAGEVEPSVAPSSASRLTSATFMGSLASLQQGATGAEAGAGASGATPGAS